MEPGEEEDAVLDEADVLESDEQDIEFVLEEFEDIEEVDFEELDIDELDDEILFEILQDEDNVEKILEEI